MILFDNYGHMVSDTSERELHRFARMIRLKREWYQTGKRLHPHYDLTTSGAKERARKAGAIQVTPQELVQRAWWRRAPNTEGEWAYPVMTKIRHCLKNGRSLCGLKTKVLWPNLAPSASRDMDGCRDCKTCTKILEQRKGKPHEHQTL